MQGMHNHHILTCNRVLKRHAAFAYHSCSLQKKQLKQLKKHKATGGMQGTGIAVPAADQQPAEGGSSATPVEAGFGSAQLSVQEMQFMQVCVTSPPALLRASPSAFTCNPCEC
jgi:hypothetical protein